MKLFCCFFFLFCIASFSVFSADYSKTGGSDGTFLVEGLGVINDVNEDIDVTGQITLGDPEMHPLVDDLDGDGNMEILFLNGYTLEIYEDRTLTAVDAFDMTNLGSNGVKMIVFDVDGDGKKEVIAVSRGDGSIEFIEYNGTHTFRQNHFIHPQPNNECVLDCVEVELCALTCVDRGVAAMSSPIIYFASFNSSEVIDTAQTPAFTCNGGSYCCMSHASIPYLQIVDIDSDSDYELVTSHLFHDEAVGSGTFDSEVWIVFGSMDGSGTLAYDDMFGVPLYQDEQSYGAFNCKGNLALKFTEPNIGNYDGAIGDGLEMAIATMSDTDNFKLYLYSDDGVQEREHPSLGFFDADGELVSNVVQMDAFPKSVTQDYCVFGFDQTDQELTLMCGTYNDGSIFYSNEQDFDISIGSFSGEYNISQGQNNYHRVAHGTQMSQATEDGKNLDEVILSYGVFSLDYDAFSGEDLVLLYKNPVGHDSAVIPADAEGSNLLDLVVQTDSNGYYVDDGFTNTEAYIDSDYSEIDPCIDDIWKTNTTVVIKVRASDVDSSDKVQARAILYYGDVNEQDSGWTVPLLNEGADFQFSFIANATVGAGQIYVMVRDPENNNRTFMTDLCVDTSSDDGCELLYFSVADSGSRMFGDGCVTSFGSTEEDIDVEGGVEGDVCVSDSDCADGYACVDDNCSLIPTAENNDASDSVKELAVQTGFPIIILIFLFIGGVAWGIYSLPPGSIPHEAKLPGVAVVAVLTIAGSVVLGLLSVIWIILLIILGLALASLYVAKRFSGGFA